ncbi:ATP-binding protein [Clostridium beijerinckii]|uniref:ATP-binding protein n=1 Tax=Clostridium beijerinckii TaxID=1520 RepID=UPI00031E2058|nr:ATP-binding protein [Clostridium beijerinckii]
MFNRESIPFAPMLIESMRSLGYSFQSAIADLIDNSISAGATRIDIRLLPTENPYLIILDNGCGMNSSEIEEAMRYGSKNPLDERKKDDLGRFGLGLKSASLSQCRKLTVVSKKDNTMSSYSWDLDYIAQQEAWLLQGYSKEEINELPEINLLDGIKNGTYILLQNFDRIKESTNDLNTTLTKSMDDTIEHLSLVFHRFLTSGLDIYVNNSKIEDKDPFLVTNKKTQFKREQKFSINGSNITVKPYILPHISALTKEDIKKVGGKERLRNEQGFYVYRNKRLIIWGTWFKLGRKEELSKLARVKVDIPNDLDYMWNIDIKKSSAKLPDIIKRNLYNCVEQSIFSSENVHKYRGRKEANKDISYIWERNNIRGEIEYKINRDIPQLKLLQESLNDQELKVLESLLEKLEESLPINALYVDACNGKVKDDSSNDTEELYADVMEQIEYAKMQGMDYKMLLNAFLKTEPYCNNKELTKKLQEVLENE